MKTKSPNGAPIGPQWRGVCLLSRASARLASALAPAWQRRQPSWHVHRQLTTARCKPNLLRSYGPPGKQNGQRSSCTCLNGHTQCQDFTAPLFVCMKPPTTRLQEDAPVLKAVQMHAATTSVKCYGLCSKELASHPTKELASKQNFASAQWKIQHV